MATVVEILELSGVPTLCASKATKEEAHLKVGEVIARALQASLLHCVHADAPVWLFLLQALSKPKCNHAWLCTLMQSADRRMAAALPSCRYLCQAHVR